MDTTMDLLNKAMDRIPSDAEYCRRLGISRTTFAVARVRGRLTPVVAGALAAEIGEDPEHWTAVAALEAAPAGQLSEYLWRRIVGKMSAEEAAAPNWNKHGHRIRATHAES